MINSNIAANATAYTLLTNATRTETTTGAAVDIQAVRGSLAVMLTSTAMSSGDTNNVKLQDSADGTNDWQDIAGATFTQVTAAAVSVQKIAVQADVVRRYIRAVATYAGDGTPSSTFSVVALGWTA
jgi:hypothetical protein